MNRNILTKAACAAIGLAAVSSAFAADPEIEAMKQQLAAQQKLIDQLMAAQARAPQSPTEASEVEQRLRDRQKGALNEPVSAAPTPAPPPPVRFYGIADVSVVAANSGAGTKMRIEGGGGKAPSRLGVQITKNISDVKVTAVAEAGLFFNTGSTGAAAPVLGLNDTNVSSGGAPGTGSQIFSRQIWAGVDAGFGQFSIGRQYTGSYVSVAAIGSAHGDGLFGNAAVLTPLIGGMPTRLNNSLIWATPQVANLRGVFTYTTGAENNISGTATAATTSTTARAGAGFDAAGIYAFNGGQVAATTWGINNASYVTAGETGLARKKGYQLSANYDFGPFRLFGNFVHGTISGGNYQNVTKTLSSATGYGLSFLVPFGKHNITAAWTRLDDKSLLNRDGTMYGLSYFYNYTPDTSFYGSVGKMQNNRNASYSLNDGSNLVGNTTHPGFSPSGLETGMNFKF